MPEQDHYAVLDLPRTATHDEIKRRYRRLMRQVHPDANGGDPEATRKAARINRAFETLGDAARRRAYDREYAPGAPRDARVYAHWAEQPDWEDIVAEHVPPKRPPHIHREEPRIEPSEIEVDVAELQTSPRVRRRIRVTNPCECSLKGDIATSEPWVWGPIGEIAVPPRGSIEFDVEVVSRKVAFPGLSRVVVVTDKWTGVVPVKITGYRPKPRRRSYDADYPYVRTRHHQKWAKYR